MATDGLAQAIAGGCIPLPPPDEDGFAAFADRWADRRVLMLGEASHGTAEFYGARAAITRRMIERHGARIVAVEADWPDAAVLDRHVRGLPPRGGAEDPFQRFPRWMWRNGPVAGLVDWMRDWNRGRDPGNQVGFYGLDMYNLSDSIRAVLDYLDSTDPEAAAVARGRYGCLEPWTEQPAAYGRLAGSGYHTCEQAVVQQCRDLLAKALEGRDQMDAAQNARLVASAERYYRVMYQGGAESWNLRDSHMADTLDQLLQAGGAGARAVVWAHNSHIGDARQTEMGSRLGEHNLGQLARERWGDGVALVGLGTDHGTVTAASDWDEDAEVMTVRPSRPGSFERLCHDSGVPRFLLDFRGGGDLAARLVQPLLQRFIGVIYRPESERLSHYMQARAGRQYDGWIWFDGTQALVGAGDGGRHDDVPDTWPFGL
ncbi:erythromycin esterase family protein [Paracoccus shandongensis]|uniref:erythromycin esterase family protein n=1 Tax=Paracoccus shandongensis TaxID=2816048 RepID=UPI001A8FE9E6|nr:erythromycin esterase family protein [Paracoccus shandongensis]